MHCSAYVSEIQRLIFLVEYFIALGLGVLYCVLYYYNGMIFVSAGANKKVYLELILNVYLILLVCIIWCSWSIYWVSPYWQWLQAQCGYHLQMSSSSLNILTSALWVSWFPWNSCMVKAFLIFWAHTFLIVWRPRFYIFVYQLEEQWGCQMSVFQAHVWNHCLKSVLRRWWRVTLQL